MTTIKLSNNVRVSDPCYDDSVWCKTRLTDVEGFEIVAGSVLLVSAGFEEPKIAEINFLII